MRKQLNLFLLFITISAEEMQHIALKTYGHVTTAQGMLINNAFLYLNKFWSDKGKSLSNVTTQQYFTPDTTLIINGKTVYTGYAQSNNHFKEVGKHIRGEIQFPLLKIISVDDKLIVHFDENIYDNNEHYYPANVIAIFTLQNGRIQKWEEVANSTYFCQAQSASVVYSK